MSLLDHLTHYLTNPDSRSALLIILSISIIYVGHEIIKVLFPSGPKHSYEGKLNEEGEYEGKGKLVALSGDIYEGDFVGGLFHGSGTYTFANSKGKYTGSFSRGAYHGPRGTEVYPDGAVYVGAFYKGLRDGKGKMKYSDGTSYTGQWRAGKKHGMGKFIYSNGDKYIGGFAEGKRHGEGVIKEKKTGKIKQGIWKFGEKQQGLVEITGEMKGQKEKYMMNKDLEAELPEDNDQSQLARAMRERIQTAKEIIEVENKGK